MRKISSYILSAKLTRGFNKIRKHILRQSCEKCNWYAEEGSSYDCSYWPVDTLKEDICHQYVGGDEE